jgi:predicted NAD/FAD-binding protein
MPLDYTRQPNGRRKVAIIGTGLAGLTAAHLLSQHPERFEVHVFEKADRFGLSAASIQFEGTDGRKRAIDSPMRLVQAGEFDLLNG